MCASIIFNEASFIAISLEITLDSSRDEENNFTCCCCSMDYLFYLRLLIELVKSFLLLAKRSNEVIDRGGPKAGRVCFACLQKENFLLFSLYFSSMRSFRWEPFSSSSSSKNFCVLRHSVTFPMNISQCTAVKRDEIFLHSWMPFKILTVFFIEKPKKPNKQMEIRV